MSAQSLEQVDGQVGHREDVGPAPRGPEEALAPPAVEVRRNPVVSVVIGAAASAIAIAYLARAAGTGSPLDWLLFALMAVVAGTFLRSLLDARTPLLVLDELGVRVRLGAQWRGLPWEAVHAVVVQPRRSLVSDGRLQVRLFHLERALEGLDRRARRHAGLNRKTYGAALAVPLGLTTRVSVAGDLADAVEALAAGRAEVIRPADEPEAAEVVAADPGGGAELPVVDAEPEPPTPARRSRWWVRPAVEADDATDLTGEDPRVVGPAPEPAQEPAQEPVLEPAQEPVLERGPERTLARQPAPAAPAGPVVVPEQGRSNVRPLATLKDPVGPLVIGDYAPEPAYDPVIGPELAAARTRVGLSVDELAERTRIRPHVIESIEVDDFAPCGGDFYARGHIRTLARVLGKDAAPMLAHFDARYADTPIGARRVFEAELASGMTGSMRSTAGGPNWALLVGVVLLLVMVWSAVRLFAGDEPELLEPPPALNGSAGLTDNYQNPRQPAGPAPLVTRLTAVDGGARVEVRDGSGALAFEGDLAIGATRTVRATPPVTVSADNAGAVQVVVGGRDQGRLGAPDQSATKVFSRGGRTAAQ